MAYVYTPAEWASIVMEYNAGTSLDTLATKFNKSVQSLRMKLVKAGIYQKQSKTAAKPETVSVYQSCLAEFGESSF